VALDLRPAANAALGFPAVGPVWVAGLYVSWALQSAGLGRAASMQPPGLASIPRRSGSENNDECRCRRACAHPLFGLGETDT